MTKIRSIFRKLAATLVVVAAWAALLPLAACAQEPGQSGIITMTTKASSEVRISIELAKGSENLTIAWGDGKESNIGDALFYDDFGRFVFAHEYSGTTARNIVITGNVTYFNCYGCQLTALDVSRCTALTDLNCGDNQLTALDVSRNTALENLECDYNQITRLDVSKNTALGIISIVGNQFTAAALNDLFRTLPYKRADYGEVGGIYLSEYRPSPTDNPGNRDCDRSIAETRGWSFHSKRR